MITSTKAEMLTFPRECELADSQHKMQMLDSVRFCPEECVTLLPLYVQKVSESSGESGKVLSLSLCTSESFEAFLHSRRLTSHAEQSLRHY